MSEKKRKKERNPNQKLKVYGKYEAETEFVNENLAQNSNIWRKRKGEREGE